MLPKELQFTYSDYKYFPEDGKRYEIIEGRLLMVPSPFTPHQKVSRNLEMLLFNYVKKKNLGEVFDAPYDVVLSEINIVQPDIIFVSKKNLNIITNVNIKGSPDLLIEIVSKTSKKNDEEVKKRIYAQSNVKEYWIVYTDEKKIKVYIEPKQGYILYKEFHENDTLSTLMFPELALKLKDIFN